MSGYRVVLFAVLAAGVAQSAWAGAGFWSSSGPYGGIVYDVEINPATPTIRYASTRGGIFKSVDGGLSWTRAEDGIVGSASYNFRLVLDSDAPNTLYTFDASGRLYRTTDGAANWAPTGFTLPTGVQAQDFAEAPGSTTKLFLATSDFQSTEPATGGLLLSTDGGATFTPVSGGVPTGRNFAAVAVDPATPTVVLAGTDFYDHPGGAAEPTLYRSADGGATWTTVRTSVDPNFTNQTTAFSFGPGGRVYVASEGTLARSDDDGATWTAVGTPALRVLAHPTTADTVFFSNSQQGLLRSTTGGSAPIASNAGASPNSSYTSTTTGTAIPPLVNGIVAEPGFPAAGSSLWLSTEGAGLLRSLDAGVTWSASQDGLAATNIRALLVHPNPATSGRIYAGFGDIFASSPALFLKPSTLASWGIANTGLRAAQLRSVVIDPTTAGTTAGDVGTSVLYAAGRDSSQLGTGYRNAGIYKSSNGGSTWTTISGGLPTVTQGGVTFVNMGTFRSIALDPRSCVPTPVPPAPCTTPLQTLYATANGHAPPPVGGVRTFGFRVIKSTNAGASWSDVSTTLQSSTVGPADQVAQVTPVPVLIDPTDSNRIWIGTFTTLGGTPTPDPQNGVFMSPDGGATWLHRSNGLPRRAGATNAAFDVLSLAIHPTNGNILWASTLLANAAPGTGSIYKTVDGGLNWTQSATGLTPGADIRAIIVDQTDPSRLYAAGAGTEANPGSVFRSSDGGATWQSFSIGLPADAALSLARDPFNATLLYAGTNTGVWEIEQVADTDGDGAPNATENNAPNGGDGNGDTQADALQTDVGSAVPLFSAADAPNGPSGGFFTSDIISGTGGACSQAVDVQATLAARNGNDPVPGVPGVSYSYPRDLVRFEILDCASAVVDITFHGADFTRPGWSFRFYGPQVPGDNATMGWYDFASRAQRVAPNRWRLTLAANQFGSYRPSPNAILFEGGPACFDTRVFASGFEDGAAQPGCD
jgi:photosystem II stability/assembly factor-like uncharacterized protein